MEEARISDIPSFKKGLEEARNFATFKRAMPFLRPIFKLLGVDVVKMDDAFANIDDLVKQVEDLASIPDRFNDLFSARGWIIYESMNLTVAKAAIEKAEAGYVDEAETDLVNHYDAETVKFQLMRMKAVKTFRPRMALAKKALTDYEEERYHACVPVILALLDGLVNELHDKRRGFFAQEVDLSAWDSIAGHNRGLNELSKIFKKGRQKTFTEQISIPYRNGIMHGMDLGYDNKVVAAKTWAALFAVREWALKAERGSLEEQPEEPQLTWRDSLQQFQEIEKDKERLKRWQKREITIGVDVSNTGEPDVFEEGTPERKLAEFLMFWKAKNYGHMARCLNSTFGARAKKNPGEVRAVFGQAVLKYFSFTEISDDAAAVTEISTNLIYEKNEEEKNKTVRYRLIYSDEEGKPQVRDKPGGQWGIINWGWDFY